MDPDPLPYMKFAVLAAGGLMHYVVASFPVYSALLREVKLQWMDEDGEIHVFDGFARYCQLLDRQLPAIAKVPVFHKNAFLIEVRIVGHFVILINKHS